MGKNSKKSPIFWNVSFKKFPLEGRHLFLKNVDNCLCNQFPHNIKLKATILKTYQAQQNLHVHFFNEVTLSAASQLCTNLPTVKAF